MFHVELRQFPHITRAFNLGAQDLNSRIVSAWVAGRPVELNDRRWEPARAKLTIYEARELAADELGMGRGWGTVSREGEDMTAHLLNAARAEDGGGGELADVKGEFLRTLGAHPVPLHRVVGLMGEDTRPASERLALAEQVVWELLHQGRLQLLDHGRTAPRDRWQPLVLSWESWVPDGAVAVQAADVSGDEVSQ